MTKKIIILVVALFSLVSCNNYSIENKYQGLTPYLEVEKTSLKEFKEIEVKDYIRKFENKESFICFFYSTDCSYCHKLIDNIINPYIIESKNMVYGLDVYKDENYIILDQIEKYQPSNNDYFSNKNSNISVSRPVVQIVEKGSVVAYEKGYTKYCKVILDSYIIN